MTKLNYKAFYKNHLPHIQPEGAIFAVSFRLAFSLPNSIKAKLVKEKAEYNKMISTLPEKEKLEYALDFNRKYFEDFDSFVDKYNNSPAWLQNKNIALIVKNALLFYNDVRYILFCFTIMPNHMHIMIKPLPKKDQYYSLSEIMHSVKSYTATKCNKLLNRQGKFWQKGHYDHIIRDAKDYQYQLNYIKQNPVKAGLVKNWKDWEYTYIADDRM